MHHKYSPNLPVLFFKIHLVLSHYSLIQVFSKVLFPSHSPIQFCMCFLWSLTPATWPTHLVFLAWISLILYKQYKLCSFLQPPGICSVLGSNKFLCPLLSHSPSLWIFWLDFLEWSWYFYINFINMIIFYCQQLFIHNLWLQLYLFLVP
jgi:hypothetical protein